MARAIAARRHGDDFQARLFWLRASALLDPISPIMKVACELGPAGFDDITVEYDPQKAPPDHEGKPILRRHFQCKWHTTTGVFGYQDLTSPAFIGATRYSLLQKVHRALVQYAPSGEGCRFELVTNWRIKPDDPLLELVRKESDAINIDRLFDGKTENSRMGRVRKLWQEHLEIDDEGLRLVARVLAIAESPESLASLRERLDEKFAVVGMKRIPAAESAFIYDDLQGKLFAQGRNEFNRENFREMLTRENLLDPSEKPSEALTIGVRSFMHPIDPMEDRCTRMLNLVPYFDGRYIRDEADWNGKVYPAIREFVPNAARSSDHLRLILDAHVSIAFSIGALLNVKSGKCVQIEQRTGGRHFWKMDDQPVNHSWPAFDFYEEIIDERTADVALAVGLTHDVSSSVLSLGNRRTLALAG